MAKPLASSGADQSDEQFKEILRKIANGTEPEDGETASTAPFGSLQLLDLPRKPLEVIEHRRNQFLSAGVLRRQGVGKKVE